MNEHRTSQWGLLVAAIGVIGIFLLGVWVGSMSQSPFSKVLGLENLLGGAPADLVQTSTSSPDICYDQKGERVPCGLGRDGVNTVSADDVADFSEFWKAWNAIKDEYVDPSVATNQERVWGAIQGLAGSLGDPYTFFMPPKEAKIFQDDVKGNFGGVGMQVGMREGLITVIAPLKGSPAEKAGILKGDVLLKIDDATTTEMSVDKAIYLIRGEIGTKVTLTFIRKGEETPRVVTVVRDVIQVPTIDTESRSDGVFVIRVYSFPETGAELFRNALREFVQSGKDKLLIDMRGNPGGYLEIAQDMASWFLPSGKVVVREETRTGDGQVFRSRGYNIFNSNLKVAILVDEGTASAAEIFSGALQEHGVAVLVGKKTFGKGSVQKLVTIADDTVLKLTVARWVLPSGKHLSGKGGTGGIEPDVLVEITKEDVEKGMDPQTDKAVEVLKNFAKYKRQPI